jgi:hypothetical protein
MRNGSPQKRREKKHEQSDESALPLLRPLRAFATNQPVRHPGMHEGSQ